MNVIAEDFLSGFILTQITYLVVGWWSILIGILAGILWVLGGQGYLGTKLWRRSGVPLTICLPFIVHPIAAIISFIAQVAAHSIGYGEIDTNDPDGSWLGRKFGRWARVVWYGIMLMALIPLIP